MSAVKVKTDWGVSSSEYFGGAVRLRQSSGVKQSSTTQIDGLVEDRLVKIGTLLAEYNSPGLAADRESAILKNLSKSDLHSYLYLGLLNELPDAVIYPLLSALSMAADENRLFISQLSITTILKKYLKSTNDMIRVRCIEIAEGLIASGIGIPSLLSILAEHKSEETETWLIEEIARVMDVGGQKNEKGKSVS